MSAADALHRVYLPAFRPAAQVLGAEPDQGAAREAHAAAAPLAAMRGYGSTVRADAARLRIAHGPFEELLTATVTIASYPGMSATAAMQGQLGQTMMHDTTVQNVFAFRAPRGQLDASLPLMGVMLSSIRINPAWQAAVSQVLLNIGNTRIKGAADRARIWHDAMNEIGAMRMQTWQSAQDSRDRISHAFSQTMRGVQTYVDPVTRFPVELTAGYRGAWSNGLGEYILSNDPGFNPNQTLRGNWTAMAAQR